MDALAEKAHSVPRPPRKRGRPKKQAQPVSALPMPVTSKHADESDGDISHQSVLACVAEQVQL